MNFNTTILLPLCHPKLVEGFVVKSICFSNGMLKQVWQDKNKLHFQP